MLETALARGPPEIAMPMPPWMSHGASSLTVLLCVIRRLRTVAQPRRRVPLQTTSEREDLLKVFGPNNVLTASSQSSMGEMPLTARCKLSIENREYFSSNAISTNSTPVCTTTSVASHPTVRECTGRGDRRRRSDRFDHRHDERPCRHAADVLR